MPLETVMRPPIARPLAASTVATPLDRIVVGATALVIAALVLAIGLAARSWVGAPFPGFFVMPNGVVPSVGLPSWTGSGASVYQRHVEAVDGTAVTDTAAIYSHARRRSANTAINYTLRGPGGLETLPIRSAMFTEGDYWAVFGGYLLSGGLYLAVGILAPFLCSAPERGRALLLLGGTGGIYALSGAALYSPAGPLRLHALSEALFPAALAYLALTLPRQRSEMLAPFAAMAGTLSLALAIPYLLLVNLPTAYSTMHAASESAMGIAGVALLATLMSERLRAGNDAGPFLRAAAVGGALGIGVPAVVLGISGLSGGKLPVNVMTVASFLFPLGLGYGLVAEYVAAALDA